MQAMERDSVRSVKLTGFECAFQQAEIGQFAGSDGASRPLRQW